MTSRICELCDAVVIDTWTYQITDKDNKHAVTGCKACIDQFEAKYKAIKNYSSKTVKQILKELN
jgi:RNase P subunit RPR2